MIRGMNIIEALEWSRANNLSVSRPGCGWIRYGEDFTLRLTGRDLLATDWEPTAGYVERITSGHWEHVESSD